MIDCDALSAALQAASDGGIARALMREVHPLKGVRGVSNAAIATLAVETWRGGGVDLDRDEDALGALFGAAFEDGLLAIALLATVVPDRPAEVLEVAIDWLGRVDDHQTADALGWVVLGPAALRAQGTVLDLVAEVAEARHPAPRRAVMMTGMALLPVPVESVAAAALRARFAHRSLGFVEAVADDELAALCTAFYRDDAPPVRKAIRRVLGLWGRLSPDRCETWAKEQRGGIARMLGDEVAASVAKARKRSRG